MSVWLIIWDEAETQVAVVTGCVEAVDVYQSAHVAGAYHGRSTVQAYSGNTPGAYQGGAVARSAYQGGLKAIQAGC